MFFKKPSIEQESPLQDLSVDQLSEVAGGCNAYTKKSDWDADDMHKSKKHHHHHHHHHMMKTTHYNCYNQYKDNDTMTKTYVQHW